MAKAKIKIKREMRRLGKNKRITYMLKHSKFIIKNASTFVGIPFDGAAVSTNALALQDLILWQRRGKKTDIDYTELLGECFDMMDANYDFVDYVSGGDEKTNNLSGLNSRKNTRTKTKRPKYDTAARWIREITPNQLTLETTPDETSKMTTIISSNDEGFKVELVQQNRIKITLGDKSCLLDFSTAARIIMKYLEGGKPVEAFIIKSNANGLAVPRKLPKIIPNVDENYKPVIPHEIPDETKDLDVIPKE